MSFKILPVTDAPSERAFLDCPRKLYAQDPHWVCPLDLEVKAVFDPKKNPNFEHGEAARWVLYDNKEQNKEQNKERNAGQTTGQVVGRIAAFFNRQKAYKFEQPTGGAGFFECINNKTASRLLFDTAKDWLTARGMQAMDCPVNFGENDRFWGLLVEGFEQPFYGMFYNPPYYEELYEDYGFYTYFTQASKILDVSKPPPERFARIAQWVMQKEGITFEYARRNQIDKYGQDFLTIYNDAWQHHPNFTPMTPAQLEGIIKPLKFVLIEEMCIFAYVRGEPAGFLIALPDLNQIFKPVGGRMSILQKLLFLWRKRHQYAWYRKRCLLTRGRVMIMGIRPAFQRFGLETGMVMKPYQDVQAMGFGEIELGWVGDFNPSMQALMDATGATSRKRHHTYRILFDPTAERTYSPLISRDSRPVSIDSEANSERK